MQTRWRMEDMAIAAHPIGIANRGIATGTMQADYQIVGLIDMAMAIRHGRPHRPAAISRCMRWKCWRRWEPPPNPRNTLDPEPLRAARAGSARDRTIHISWLPQNLRRDAACIRRSFRDETLGGPANLLVAQIASDEAPFNSLASIARWAAIYRLRGRGFRPGIDPARCCARSGKPDVL